jgi:hypothetical protein
MNTKTKYLVGVYSDPDDAIAGVRKIRAAGVKVYEVFSPFAIHGIDDALGYKRSRLPIAAFMFGALGTTLALTMQFWMMGIDWPMIIGGKNFVSVPPFIPVTFELTVLVSALGMVGTFMIASDLKPYKKPKIFDIRATNDKFIVVVDALTNAKLQADLGQIMRDAGAEEVNEKSFD